MHWGFYSILWWAIALLVGAAVYRTWRRHRYSRRISELAAMAAITLTGTLGVLLVAS